MNSLTSPKKMALTSKSPQTPLTIEKVLSCVAFPGELGEALTGELGEALTGLTKAHYGMALGMGKTEEEAAKIAMLGLTKQLLEMSLKTSPHS